MSSSVSSANSSHVGWTVAFFGLLLAHVWVTHIGWADISSVEEDFRQAQTAISTYYVQQDQNYHLAYPTPVLGKPWSIPLEFPLYQWTIAKLATWFNWPLIQTGRGVSMVCFYLTIPVWYLLLGTAGLPHNRRLAVLMVLLTCPIYLYHSRSFLIEAMALMFATWHAWFVVETMRRQRWLWLLGACVSGIFAALVKMTTWAVVLIPCAVYGLWLLWSHRPPRSSTWKETAIFCSWSVGAVLPALTAGWWWVHTADAIRALNPAAFFLNSASVNDFVFGTLAQRTSVEFWTTLNGHWTTAILPLSALIFIAVAGLLLPGRSRGLVGLCLAGFFGSQLIFSNLYYLHTYYFFANAFMLTGALGLAGCHLLDYAKLPRWLRLAGWLGLLAVGGLTYSANFLPRQRMVLTSQSGLSSAIQALTVPNDVIAILGDDWSSAIPFSARRRALMARADIDDHDSARQASLKALADERVALLIVKSGPKVTPQTVRHRIDELQMHPQPLFSYEGRVEVYLRKDMLHDAIGRLRGATYAGIDIPASVPTPAGEQRFDRHRDRAAFIMMTPFPMRFHTPFGAPPWLEFENRPAFIAHTPTELEFEVPQDARNLTIEFGMIPEAYLQNSSDGVDIVVETPGRDGASQVLWSRQLAPREVPGDRGRLNATIALPSPASRRVLLRTLPGPHKDAAFDWVYFSEVTFR